MKNHEWVDGKLLQTNKKYSHLKLKQKEKIYQWMYESYRAKREELGRFPDSKDTDDVLEPVMDKIEEAQIWIPCGEVAKHYRSIVSDLRKRYNREQMGKAAIMRARHLHKSIRVHKAIAYIDAKGSQFVNGKISTLYLTVLKSVL